MLFHRAGSVAKCISHDCLVTDLRNSENARGFYKQWKLLEPMRVAVVGTPSNGGMDPKLAIFCKQPRLPVVGVGHQLSYKTYHP